MGWFSRIARSTAVAAPTASARSNGTVTAQVQKGKTTQIDLLQAFGGPNISTTDRDGVETWVYERTATQSDVQSNSQSAQFLRDLVGVHVSAGTVHNVHNVHGAAAELAGVINGVVDLSPIEVGVAAMFFTSSTRSKAWPTRWLASSRATRRAARRCKFGSTKDIDATENATSSDNASLPARACSPAS